MRCRFKKSKGINIMNNKDIRTLCYRCMMEMRNAGVKVQRVGGARSKCDKCQRPGSNYVVK